MFVFNMFYEKYFDPYSKYKTITTSELKAILDSLPNTPQKDLFVREVPKSNYSTVLGTTGARGAGAIHTLYTMDRHVEKTYNKLYSDDLTILQHINIVGMNNNSNCYLGLSEHQSLLLDELRK